MLNATRAYSNALLITSQDADSVLFDEVKTMNYQEKKEEKPLYIQKKEEVKLLDTKTNSDKI